MATGEIIGVGRTAGGLPVPYRTSDLVTSLAPCARAPQPLIQVEPMPDSAPFAAALSAYAEGETRDALRLPQGFFRSRTV